MPYYRTVKRDTLINENSLYNKFFLDKGVKSIRQLGAATLIYPSAEDLKSVSFINHIWTQGDSYEKLSSIYYGDPTYWWIIAFMNKKTTEQHLSVGENISIPTPLVATLSIIGA